MKVLILQVMSDSPSELRILHSDSSTNMDSLPDSHEIVLADDSILTAAAGVEVSDFQLIKKKNSSKLYIISSYSQNISNLGTLLIFLCVFGRKNFLLILWNLLIWTIFLPTDINVCVFMPPP